MTCLLCLALLAAGDSPKKDAPDGVPAVLKGDWPIQGVTDATSSAVDKDGKLVIKIGDDSAEWKAVPKFWEKEGKAKMTATGDGKSGTFEWTLRDKVFKGLYKLEEALGFDGKKHPMLTLTIGHAGKEAPKQHAKFEDLPKDIAFKIQCMRP